jgi:hypothetical protein
MAKDLQLLGQQPVQSFDLFGVVWFGTKSLKCYHRTWVSVNTAILSGGIELTAYQEGIWLHSHLQIGVLQHSKRLLLRDHRICHPPLVDVAG